MRIRHTTLMHETSRLELACSMQEAHTYACAMTAFETSTFETSHWAHTLSCKCGNWVASMLELGCPYSSKDSFRQFEALAPHQNKQDPS